MLKFSRSLVFAGMLGLTSTLSMFGSVANAQIPIPLPFCLSCGVGCGPVGTVPCAGFCSGGWCYCACGMGASGTLTCTCR
jgi:hypothetical protein